jgi:multiple sugar transport system permease protein
MTDQALPRVRTRLSTLSVEVRKNLWIYLVLLPPFALLTIFTLVPVVQSFLLSFQNWTLRQVTDVGLDNYKQLFNDPIFWKAMQNTTVYTLIVVPLGIATALFLAELIRPLSMPVQTFFKAAYYLPAVVAAVVVVLVWRWIYNSNSYGLVNYILSFVGQEPIPWLQSSQTAFGALTVTSLIGGHGASVVLLLAAMGSIPQALYESARLDGSRRWDEFRFITLPLLRPTLLYLAVLNTINSFQLFVSIFLLTNGGPNNSTTTLAFSIFRSGFIQYQFGYASAQAAIMFVILLVITILYFRLLSDDVEY